MTLLEAAAALGQRKISSVELTEAALERIGRLNPATNAMQTVMAEAAREQARQADVEFARGECRGTLHGVPVAVKDLFYTKGVRTTNGSKLFATFVPDHDAAVVERLTNAGVPVEEVRLNQRDAFFDSPANRAAGLVAQYRQAEWGAMLQPGAMWYFGDLGVRLELAPPALGEHTVSVLTELGFSPADVATLIDNGTAVTLATAATAQP